MLKIRLQVKGRLKDWEHTQEVSTGLTLPSECPPPHWDYALMKSNLNVPVHVWLRACCLNLQHSCFWNLEAIPCNCHATDLHSGSLFKVPDPHHWQLWLNSLWGYLTITCLLKVSLVDSNASPHYTNVLLPIIWKDKRLSHNYING